MRTDQKSVRIFRICIFQKKRLSPDFFCDFLYQCELCPLVCFCQLVADFAGSESALRAQAKAIQRDILCCFVNPCNHCLLVLQFRLLGSDQTENHLFIRRNLCKRFEAAASFVIIFQQQGIYIFLCKNIVCNRIIRSAGEECRVIVRGKYEK